MITYSLSQTPASWLLCYKCWECCWKTAWKSHLFWSYEQTTLRRRNRDKNLLWYTLLCENLTHFSGCTEKNSAMCPACTHMPWKAAEEGLRAGPLHTGIFHHSKCSKEQLLSILKFPTADVLSCVFLSSHFLITALEQWWLCSQCALE